MKPTVFEITAPNGKTYEIEANEGVSEEEALAQFQALPETEWGAFEMKAPAAPARTPKATAQQTPKAEPKEATPMGFAKGQTTFTQEFKENPEVNAVQAELWNQGVRDPAAINRVLNERFPGRNFDISSDAIKAAEQYEKDMAERGVDVKGNVFATFNDPTGRKDPERPDTLGGVFGDAMQRNLATTGNTVAGLGALGADLVGMDDTAEEMLKDYEQRQIAIANQYGTGVTLDEVDDLGDVGMYLADTAGELLPDLATGLGGGLIGKQIGKRVVKGATEDVIEKAAQRGAMAGAMVPSVGQETGATYGNTFVATKERAPLTSIMAGVASGSLDAILPTKVLSDIGGQALVDSFKRKFLMRAAREGGKNFAIEGGTEALQEFITALPEAGITGKLPENLLDNMVEAFVKGGIGGTMVGTGTAAVQGTVQALNEIGQDPQANPQFPTETTIVEPKAPVRNSKAFRAELKTATEQTQALADNLTSTWTNAPTEVTALPNFVKEAGIDNEAIGVYTEDGRVLINTEMVLKEAKRRGVSPDAMATSVVFHEALGHHGLTQTYGNELDEMLMTLYDRGSDQLRDRVDTWIAKNPKAYFDGDPNGRFSREDYQRLRAMEEVMASEPERNGQLERTFYDRVADTVKNLARKMGFDWKYSSREVRSILAVSQRNVVQGQDTGFIPGVLKNLRVFHGSPHTFAATENNPLGEFDHSKMGSGEGQQVFGWGTYLTESRGIAEKTYRDRLSTKAYTWRGNEGVSYELRNMARAEAAPLYDQVADRLEREIGVELNVPNFVDAAITQAFQGEGLAGFARDYYDDTAEVWGRDGEWSGENQTRFKEATQEIVDIIENGLEVTSSGKVYEVDIPDNGKWLDWNRPLSEQPALASALKEVGIYGDPSERKDAEEQLELFNEAYKKTSDEFREVSKKLKTDPENIFLRAQIDKLGDDLDDIADAIESYTRKLDMSGEGAYRALSEIVGGDRNASEWLASKGFTGNRFLADNIAGNKTPKFDGTDTFNYVIFDDKTPKIVNRYMRSSGPIDPDELAADDLIEATNALNLLERASELYTPTVVNIDDLEQAVVERGVKPSDVTRLATMAPAQLAKRVFMYDVAADKLQKRMLDIQEDIETNGLTPEKQARFLETKATFEGLVLDIFNFQAEIGRTLNFMRKANFTRKRVNMTAAALREMLDKNDMGALADPETFLKFMRKTSEGIQASQTKTTKPTYGSAVLQLAGVPRALMSSFDLSAPMRQGVTLVGTTQYWKSFFKMFTFLGKSGRENYDYLMKTITRDPNYELMLVGRLSFTELDGKLGNREEDFQTDLAEKIPVLGKGVKQSEQAYAGFLNKLRADTFSKLVQQYKDAGLLTKDADGNWNDVKLITDLGKFVNSATGRAELPGGLKSAGPQLNTLFFSSRLIQSRFNMLNPVFYARLSAPVRKEAIKSMVAMGTAAAAMTWALSLIPDEEEEDVSIETDPRSSDFMKIKVNDTRFDLGGGYYQYLTLGARTSLWISNQLFGTDIPEMKSTAGKERYFGGDGKYDKDYIDEFLRFFRNKLSPNASYVVDAMVGSDVIGREFDVFGSAASRMVPMFLSSLYTATEQEGAAKGIRYSVPGLFGVGVATYVPATRDPKQKIDAPDEFKKQRLTGEAKDWWEATEKNHFKSLVEVYSKETGFATWDQIPKKAQEEIIAEAKKKAREYTREDAEMELVSDE